MTQHEMVDRECLSCKSEGKLYKQFVNVAGDWQTDTWLSKCDICKGTGKVQTLAKYPDYLVDANKNVEDAHTALTKLEDDGALIDLIAWAKKTVNWCEQTARDAYVQWQQEQCPHTVTRTEHIGEYWMVQGEPDDDDVEGPTFCIKCNKEI